MTILSIIWVQAESQVYLQVVPLWNPFKHLEALELKNKIRGASIPSFTVLKFEVSESER